MPQHKTPKCIEKPSEPRGQFGRSATTIRTESNTYPFIKLVRKAEGHEPTIAKSAKPSSDLPEQVIRGKNNRKIFCLGVPVDSI